MIELLKKTFLFDSLSPAELKEVSKLCSPSVFRQGELICRQGEKNDRLYIIGFGQVKVSIIDEQKNERPLSFLSSGNSFGEMSLITGEPASANVTAVIDTDMYVIEKANFEKIISRHPSVPLKINYLLSQRLKETNLDLKKLETGFTLLCSPKELSRPLFPASLSLAGALAEKFNQKVILLLFLNDTGRPEIEKLINHSLSKKEENENFTIYQSNKNLSIGLMTRQGECRRSQIDSSFLGKLFSEYDQVLAATCYEETATQPAIFSQAKKTISLLPVNEDSQRYQWSKKDPAKTSDTAIAFIEEGANIEEAARGFRSRFHGPLFTLCRSESFSVPSSGILRAARFIMNKSIGVVLGGGGARGFAHIGVMKALQKNRLEPDAFCGSSMGGIVASFYAMGLSTEEAVKTISYHAKKKGNKFDFQFPLRSLIKGKKLKNMAKEVYGERKIEDLLHQLYLVCADLVSGEEVVLEKGDLKTAVFASCDLPGVMPPVKLNGQYLVDGGVLNKVPVSVLKERGIQHVIAVNVTPKKDVSFAKSEPHILKIITRSMDLVNYKLSYAEIGTLDLLIQPHLGDFEFFGFKDIDGIIDVGEKTAEEAMGKIEKLIYS